MKKWLISCKLHTTKEEFSLAALKDILMEQSMMHMRIMPRKRQWKLEKIKGQKRKEAANKINAEAQEQENAFQKEEEITNASAKEDMREDIVKKVKEKNKILI